MNRTQIETLETAAGTAGDLLQAAICQIALNGEPTKATYDALSTTDRVDLHRRFDSIAIGGDEADTDESPWMQITAQDECERVIAENE